jgi:hypothetical protein
MALFVVDRDFQKLNILFFDGAKIAGAGGSPFDCAQDKQTRPYLRDGIVHLEGKMPIGMV